MAVRTRLRRFARSTVEKLVKSENTPDGLKEYWEKKLAKFPKKKEFVVGKRK